MIAANENCNALAGPALDLENVTFAYGRRPPVLHLHRLKIEREGRVFLFGPSGSGKTTLLGLLAGVLTANSGRVSVLSQDLTAMSGPQRDAFRGTHLGYIFQLFNLISYLTVEENIALPCRLHPARLQRLGRVPLADAVGSIAERLGIAALLKRNVMELSVGQQQRVAAARALLCAPEVVIADEPTSSLDYDHRERFIEMLFENCAAARSTLIFVSHDRSLMPLFSQQVSLAEINAASSS
jgi:putative ABC transport system ATP-binding protein